ncbi:Carbamoyl-phosphate synthase [Savitreella phatthalungensis]
MRRVSGTNGHAPTSPTPALSEQQEVRPSTSGVPSSVGQVLSTAGPAAQHPRVNITPTALAQTHPYPPVSAPASADQNPRLVTLELKDGSAVQGYSFGADKTVAGELVFQTGMVGYPESITDPSYRGQILVITYPLVGNYGVPDRQTLDGLISELPAYFESIDIHVAGLVVGTYAFDYSHFLAKSSLADWLKEKGIPAIYGVDTRALTKKIRNQGSMLGRLLMAKVGTPAVLEPSLDREAWRKHFETADWTDPNERNLVPEVSIKQSVVYRPKAENALKAQDGTPLRVLCVDVGMKANQIRCFVKRGVEMKVVPWNTDFTAETEPYHGLFISNGPGDPAQLTDIVERLRKVMATNKVPIFGICLGHQLLSRAAGAETRKMKFGNRGHNIPCTSRVSGKCYITSQNHGYAVDAASLPQGWSELFVNANDGSNEGVHHDSLPFFSVQFHPESTPGPRDTEFLFDVFIDVIQRSNTQGSLQAVRWPGGLEADNRAAHPRLHPKKVLVLGSGGLSIGQAGEFDYSGSQAIKALKEEGIYTVLINPNIATIQTSKGLADKVYFLPVNPDSVRKVIKHERPDAIYVTFGGQTALSVGIALKDEFEALGVKVLGTPIDTVITTEDRELFARSMEQIGEKCAVSSSATSVDEAVEAGKRIGFPVIVRAAYALGGLGSGFADNEQQLIDLCKVAFAASPQVLVEKSMKGWKEIEYEVVRDCNDNCITVCNMENFDPLGIHTGDSIVVAPSQTLSDEDYNMLRTTAVNVIRHLGVVGECNIQYALNPFSREYCIIEVNARLSRSSALASKATGYPLAYTAAKLGLNIPLNEIKNSVTKETCACFEPSLDYCVVKIPRWDLKKFTRVSTLLSSSMKSVGEVMSIGRTFEEAIQKAIRATNYSNLGFNETDALMSIDDELQTPSDQRLFAIANAMHQGYSVDKIWQMTKIDKWFLTRLQGLMTMEKHLKSFAANQLPATLLRSAKQLGFSDQQIAQFVGSNEFAIRRLRVEAGIQPFVKQIDTVAAEFPAYTNYLYMTYNASEHDLTFDDHGVMVLGSGVYRIGSSVEFDWCAVTAVRTLRQKNVKTIMVNYNPETVSTDYDEADRLYFENITIETVLDIYDTETSNGVIISMGGQTPNNIALDLHRQNVRILGTSPEMIDNAENRYKFSRMLDRIEVDQPTWSELTSTDEAAGFCKKVGYPVLVRPSYVLSGAAMNTVYSEDDLSSYLKQAVEVSREYPVVITKYIENAKEIEMDAVAVDGKLVMHCISEHVENAGVHSGDATLIQPPQDLDPETVRRIELATAKIGNALNVTGPFNIQFIAKDNDIKVIECNVRAARSFPFVSKVVGVNLIEMATLAILGMPVTPYPKVSLPKDYVGIKVPQFSFSRLSGADPVLGVEMASTGEVACFGHNKYEAYLKALVASGIRLPKKNILLSIGSYKEKMELLPAVKKLHSIGFKIFATSGTADFLQEHGIPVKYLEALPADGGDDQQQQKSEYSLTHHLANNLIDMYVNLPSANRFRRPANYMSSGYRSRRMAVDYSIPIITNIKCAKLMIEGLVRNPPMDVVKLDAQSDVESISLPGLVNVSAFVPEVESGVKDVMDAHVAAGFSMARVLPIGTAGSIKDAAALRAVRTALANSSACDFNVAVAATADNTGELKSVQAETGSLFLPFNLLSGTSKVAAIASHFSSWPDSKPIVTDAKSTDLASVLLLASLHNRRIHVTNVTSQDDISLVVMSKDRGLDVSCDVSVFALFLSQAELPEANSLPTKADQDALWNNIEAIDCFSVGTLPQDVARELGQTVSAGFGVRETLPLLFGAVADGRLKREDIVARLHDNPIKIFRLHEQTGCSVEVDFGVTRQISGDSQTWSPFSGKTSPAFVHRVVIKGQTTVLDGNVIAKSVGSDYSASFDKRNTTEVEMPSSPLAGPQQRRSTFVPSTIDGALLPPSTTGALTTPAAADALGLAPSALPAQVAQTQRQRLVDLINNTPFLRKHILSVDQFTRQDLHVLFTVASEMRTNVQRDGVLDLLSGRLITTMFYEPSTRTSSSFDAAMQRLGGRTVAIAAEMSSVRKGETLADTIYTLSSYGDAIVLRHPSDDSAQIAARHSPVPVINAGNGSKEHPTQAFLDLFTIREELGTVNGLNITFLGDLRYGRTVHSLSKLLRYYSVHVNFVSPAALRVPEDIKADLRAHGVSFSEHADLSEVIADTDVLYCTRVQAERFADASEYESLKDSYVVDKTVMSRAKRHMIVMHPLPRNNEIAEEVDYDSRAVYLSRQMRMGLYVRMALLACVLGAR